MKQQFEAWDDLKQCRRLQRHWGSYDKFLNKKKKRPVFTALSKLIRKYSKPTVLEVGCGCGHWLWLIHRMGVPIVGQDYSEHMRQITVEVFAKRNVAIKVRGGSCWDLPFSDDAMDISFQIDVCMHIGGSWESIQEMLRVSRRAVFFTGPSFEKKGELDYKIRKKPAMKCWGIGQVLLEKELMKLKQDGRIARFYYEIRPPTRIYKHKILIIEKS